MVDFKKLMGLFGRGNRDLPPGVEKLLRRTDRPDDLLKGIDKLLAENQVKLQKLKREFTALESNEREEKAKIEAGGFSERGENFVLDNLARLDIRLKAIEGEMDVLSRNINGLTLVEGKIKEGQAMALAGFTEEQIEAMLLDHAERKEAHYQTLAATDVAGDFDPLHAQQEARRKEQKAKILAEKASREAQRQDQQEEAKDDSQEAPSRETAEAEPEEAPVRARQEPPPRELELE